MKNLSIIIPCFNEEGNIDNLFNSVEKLIEKNKNLEIIIVENGSTDQSLKKIQEQDLYKKKLIKLVIIDENKGYGFGIMQGVYSASGKYISWCHADMQTTPQDVVNAFLYNFEKLEEQKLVIKGKRINRNYFDQIFTLGMSVLASLIFGKKLSDINAQPKIFPKEFINHMKYPPNDFSLDVYFLVTAIQNNYKIIEHTVNWNQRTSGEAKGGGSLKLKLNLTIQTIKCIIKMKKNNL